MDTRSMDRLPKPRRGVKRAHSPVTAPTAGAVTEPAMPHVVDPAGLPALGGALSRLSNDSGVLELVREGLPFSMLEELTVAIGAAQKELAQVVGIPATTLGRRKRAGRLTPAESDRLVRIARLTDMVLALMRGDTAAAQRWLSTPQEILDDETPLHRASTETGGREVEQLIGRLRHGVFS